METIEVLFLGIEGFEALASLPHCRASPVVTFKDQNISAREERALQ